MFTRRCPICRKKLTYKNKHSLKDANEKNRRCYKCRVVNRKGKNVECSWCQTPIYRRPSCLKKRKRHFCSLDCQRKYASKYQSGKNSKLWKGGEELQRKKYRELVNKRKLKNKQRAITILGGKCSVPTCGYNKCIDALEFHHINPKEKDTDVCKILGREWSEKIEEEIGKCKLLCSNCHKEHHWNERHYKA